MRMKNSALGGSAGSGAGEASGNKAQ